MKTIRQMWSQFEEMVLSPQTSRNRKELKMAFYGGAAAVLANMKRMADEDADDEQAREAIAKWYAEVEQFIFDGHARERAGLPDFMAPQSEH